MNTRHAANFANLSPPLIRLIVVCFSFPLAPQPPTTRSTLFECSCAVYCCVWSKIGCPWPRIGSGLKYECCNLLCLPPPSPSTQLIVTSPGQSPPSRLFIKSIRAGLGPIVVLVPPPEHILCWKAARMHHRPIFVLPRRLFHQPHGKIDGLIGDGGKGRHQRWCRMALVAIIRWFGGHRTSFRWSIDELMDFLLWAVREKVRYLVRTLTKNSVFAQLTFFNRSLSDLKVSFVNKYQYLICRAWSELSKTVLTLI